jgi:hypothetical protein
MPRKLCLEFPGACYHVVNRGNYRADVFLTDRTKAAFVSCLFAACARSEWVLHEADRRGQPLWYVGGPGSGFGVCGELIKRAILNLSPNLDPPEHSLGGKPKYENAD